MRYLLGRGHINFLNWFYFSQRALKLEIGIQWTREGVLSFWLFFYNLWRKFEREISDQQKKYLQGWYCKLCCLTKVVWIFLDARKQNKKHKHYIVTQEWLQISLKLEYNEDTLHYSIQVEVQSLDPPFPTSIWK